MSFNLSLRQPLAVSDRPVTPTRERILALDGLRGLAILLVLLFHLQPCAAFTGKFGGACQKACVAGWCGVDLFFVLSGFLITTILLESRGGPHYFRNFYVRRALRILPLYYGCLAFLLFCPKLPRLFGPQHALLRHHQAWLWLFLQNFALVSRVEQFPCGTNHFWSLAVEEHFYLLWPALVFFFSPRALKRIALGAIALSLGVRVACLLLNRQPSWTYFPSFSRLDGLAAGALVALCLAGSRGGRWIRWGMGSALAVGLLSLLFVNRFDGLSFHPYGPAMRGVGYTALAVFFAGLVGLVASAAEGGPLSRAFSTPVLTVLGKYSFGLYVWHFPIQFILIQRWSWFWLRMAKRLGSQFPIEVASTHYLFAATVLLLALLTSWLSWHLFEKQFLKLKRFFPAQGPAVAAAPVEPLATRRAA